MSTAPQESSAAARVRAEAAILDTPWQAVIGTVLPGEIVYWNAAAERLYGWTYEEVEGRSILDVTPTSISREQGAKILDLLNLGRSWSGVFEVRSKSGKEFRVRVRDIPVTDSAGELIGLIGVSSLWSERDAASNLLGEKSRG